MVDLSGVGMGVWGHSHMKMVGMFAHVDWNWPISWEKYPKLNRLVCYSEIFFNFFIFIFFNLLYCKYCNFTE